MAKAADVPLGPDMSFAEAASLTVDVRAEEVWHHAENVLDVTDIERVHAMRVATRRLRAVLEIFDRLLAFWTDLERDGFRARLEYALEPRPHGEVAA